ncbi:glycosyltransferase family 4 protein [Rhizorhabdus phycosphaerae]|uniref:glycosyltransferase family 4 protein n=1 Tax=Rhizorhabdus phycosphaerae TaxID=2711156 RepID=UPI0013EAF2C3|nr:glycosyltransferase family 1 protein [Rhizorhabdus phycosphaerae]
MATRDRAALATGLQVLPDGVEIILDISRLLSRTLHAMPTGIDRVELVYARQLIDKIPNRLHFAAVNPLGLYGRLPTEAVLRFIAETEARWSSARSLSRREMLVAAGRSLASLRPRPVPRRAAGSRRYYIQASPHHLDRPERVQAKLQAEGARFVCLVHDLIPIEYPEYARPNGADTHRRRIATMGAFAQGLIANSQATADSLTAFLGESAPPVRVAHLGCDPLPSGAALPAGLTPPYFVVLSTIEPRKNHLLLLNIWRRMVETLGPEATPQLAIVGRRGWENENVIDMLERCDSIKGHVHELSGLPDHMVGTLLRNARALLCPSFAEGFGMPVTEALLSGTPALCSDLPALREAGGTVPEFLDPLDGPGWLAAITDYAHDGSAARLRQIERMQDWTPPTWDAHIATVLDLVRDIDARGDMAK